MKKIIYKDKRNIYFIVINIRPVYYKGRLNNKKIVSKVRVSKDKFYNSVNKLKRLNRK